MIVHLKREMTGEFKVVVYGSLESLPLVSFTDVKTVLIDGKPVEEDEVVLRVFEVRYDKAKKEIRLITKK